MIRKDIECEGTPRLTSKTSLAEVQCLLVFPARMQPSIANRVNSIERTSLLLVRITCMKFVRRQGRKSDTSMRAISSSIKLQITEARLHDYTESRYKVIMALVNLQRRKITTSTGIPATGTLLFFYDRTSKS